MPLVLVVDDDASVRFTLRAILEDEGISVEEAPSGAHALERVRKGDVDLVLTDLRMPGLSGIELLEALSELAGAPRAILITAHGSERTAVEAMKRGALDYFSKPFHPDEIVRVVRRSLASVDLARENRALRARLLFGTEVVLESPAMRRVAERVERIAGQDVTVLITGESGTGKELVAQALVAGSRRSAGPFVRVNCAAIAQNLAEDELFGHSRGAFTGATERRAGIFREADGGTLFLDEIGELEPRLQAALLRALQGGEIRPVGSDRPVNVNVRVLAATNRNLAEEVAKGRFRQDLYFRLNVVNVHIPPLRDRPDDLLPLIRGTLRRCTERYGLPEMPTLSDAVVERLRCHPWPGNIRELEHTLERLVLLAPGPAIDQDPFEEGSEEGPPVSLTDQVALFEKGLILDMMRRCDHNQSEAARRLGISRPTLIDKLKRYQLK